MDEPASAAVEEADLMFPRRGCCCFWVPHFGSRQMAPARAGGMWERIGGRGTPPAASEATFSDGPWWKRALRTVREWSEIVAGPRWKTFIRRFNRNNRCVGGGCAGGGEAGSGGGRGSGPRLGKFQYDPLSYALNFDDGHGQDGEDDADYGYRNFSARYVLPASLPRSSMDLGGRDSPALFTAA